MSGKFEEFNKKRSYCTIKYYDKNGAEIKNGMFLRMADGSIEKIYEYMDADGTYDLGINASNREFYEARGLDIDIHRELYPLSQFDLKNAELCEPEFGQAQMMSQSM